jgi:pimeloyl-ACP methyl ester carboxylesterase
MNRILIGSGVSLIIITAGYLLLLPMSGALIRYLLWSLRPDPASMRESVKTADATIYFNSYGSGPAVLLLHGGLSNRFAWFSQIPWLVATGRQVVVPDTRGHGRSGLGHKELNYRLLASDAIAVMDYLKIQQADVVGWSDGGNTALLMGRYWPDRVGRMVSISANFNPSGLTSQALEESKSNSTGLKYWLTRWWTGAGDHLHELESRIKRMWRNYPVLQPVDLEEIATPTLVIVGKHDMISVKHAKRMAELLPEGKLVVLPGGHSTPVTQSTQINKEIGTFLEYSPTEL